MELGLIAVHCVKQSVHAPCLTQANPTFCTDSKNVLSSVDWTAPLCLVTSDGLNAGKSLHTFTNKPVQNSSRKESTSCRWSSVGSRGGMLATDGPHVCGCAGYCCCELPRSGAIASAMRNTAASTSTTTRQYSIQRKYPTNAESSAINPCTGVCWNASTTQATPAISPMSKCSAYRNFNILGVAYKRKEKSIKPSNIPLASGIRAS